MSILLTLKTITRIIPRMERKMSSIDASGITYATLNIGSARYAVVPEALLLGVCKKLGIRATPELAGPQADSAGPIDAQRLTARLIERRRHAGLSQAELARRAGIRIETLNRIERGHVTPDFATIRKLVVAMNKAEAAQTASDVRKAVSR